MRRKLTGAWSGPLRPDVLGLSGAALGSLGVAVVALRVWRGRLDVPMQIAGDAGFYHMLVKGIVDHGWHWTNPSLGAPFGQQLYDFPQGGDNLNLLIIKVLGTITGDAALTTNVFFLLSFPLTALGAYTAFRWLRLSIPTAVLLSVLFAVLPVHFMGGEDRLLHNAAYAVPLACCLLIAVLRGDALFSRRRDATSRWTRPLSRRSLATATVCVVVGSASPYYAMFTIVLLLVAAVVAVAARPSVRTALVPVGVVALIAAVLVVNHAPSIVYQLRHGGNPQVADRSPHDAETWPLKISLLMLPQPGHRVPALARLNDRYAEHSIPGPNEAYGASLGIVGGVGAVMLFIIGLSSLVGRRPAGARRSLATVCAAAAGITVLVATQGGISSLIANFVSPQIRVWSRISMFVAFLCLVAVGLLLEWAFERIKPRQRTAVRVVTLLVVGAIGVLDQTTDRTIPAYARLAAEWDSDGAFVDQIERRLSKGAAVFQLPYVFFPEDLKSPTGAYEPGRGYLHSFRLRWSWGAMHGRPADWARYLPYDDPAATVRAVTAAGFEGLWIDRRGYGDDANPLVSQYASLLGSRAMESPDRRFVFFDLRPYARRLRGSIGERRFAMLGRSTLEPHRRP